MSTVDERDRELVRSDTDGHWQIDGDKHHHLRFVALTTAAVGAIALAASPGLGLAVALLALLVATAFVVHPRADLLGSVGVTASLVPWLVVRHNSWLAISVVFTVLLAVAVITYASGTDQRLTDLRWGSVFRRARVFPPVPSMARQSTTTVAVLRGLVIAVPIITLFGILLASADAVFAELISPDRVPFGRVLLFVALVPLVLTPMVFGAMPMAGGPAHVRRRLGSIESTVVLTLVAALFGLFVVVRFGASQSLPETDDAFRSTVRAGFFQLLAVAALTVVLLLWMRRTTELESAAHRRRFLGLALVTVVLAALVDVFALKTIADYVSASFNSPLRYWSYGFGLMLLAILAVVGLRLAGFFAERHWVSIGFIAIWVMFLHLMALSNPDVRIAEYSFANPQVSELGEVVIAVNPLIWLSDDATPTIIENLSVLKPMSNDRHARTSNHLCEEEAMSSWRDWNFSRADGEGLRNRLCGD